MRSELLGLCEFGAKVVISSRKADACQQVAEKINAAGGTAIAQPANISEKPALQALVDRTLKEWGRIDILVCNAAVNPHSPGEAGRSPSAWNPSSAKCFSPNYTAIITT